MRLALVVVLLSTAPALAGGLVPNVRLPSSTAVPVVVTLEREGHGVLDDAAALAASPRPQVVLGRGP